jgi:imidazole glycerol-phosphate synthase subunit HisF
MKKRLIPVVFAFDGYLVRSEDFSWHQRLGNLTAQVARFSQWNLDELVYIDIGAARNPALIDDNYFITRVKPVSEVCRMPLTFGGGIKTEKHAEQLFRYGADKIVMSTASVDNPLLIKRLSDVFGCQAICISLDIKLIDGNYFLTTNAGQKIHKDISISEHIKKCEQLGCGEFFLNAVHRDGTASGYDIDLINLIGKLSSVPVIACGGANSARHFKDAIENTSVSALAAGNFFNFRELSYPILKNQLFKKYSSIFRRP